MICSVARPMGINSSIMMWYAGPTMLLTEELPQQRQHQQYHHANLYYTLVEHYCDFRKVIYKFDHYLEMMLFNDDKLYQSNSRTINEAETDISDTLDMKNSSYQDSDVNNNNNTFCDISTADNIIDNSDIFHYCYSLQDIHPGKIIDYHNHWSFSGNNKEENNYLDNTNNQFVSPVTNNDKYENNDKSCSITATIVNSSCCTNNDNSSAAIDVNYPSSDNTAVTDTTAIICFPLSPKPHEAVVSNLWIAEHWK